MKRLFFLMTLAASSIAIQAQDTMSRLADTLRTTQESYGYANTKTSKSFIWSIGIEPSMPVGHFRTYSSFGLGGSLQGEYKAGSMIGLTINAGYIDYFGKTANGISYSDFKYWPIMGGAKFYMGKSTFFHPQAGAGFGTNGLGTSFWYGAGLGFNLGKTVDAEFKYAGWKQHLVGLHGTSGGTGGTGGYGPTGGTGGTGGTTGGGGGYGGHYSTLGVRLGINF